MHDLSEQLAEAALQRWTETAGGVARLINLSENHTYLVTRGDGLGTVLRLHRPGYNDRAAIGSELAWLQAIRNDTAVPVPQPLAGLDGAIVQHVGDRYAVLFAFEPGAEPQADEDLRGLFGTLGRYAAQLHLHSQTWVRPIGFVRPRWDAAAILDPGPWGDWRQTAGVAPITHELSRVAVQVRDGLAAYGTSQDRFGLIHADMRLANVLVAGGAVTLIDFDDSGEGWFAYDFAAAVSFFEGDAQVPALKAAWLKAYRAVRPFSAADEAAIDLCVLLRRFALLAWIGTHGETELAQAQAKSFAADTLALGRRLLG